MQPIHLAIGLVEGLITAAVLLFVYEARPELLERAGNSGKNRMSLKGVIGVLCAAAIVIGGGLSLLASSHPDGLEWSIEKITGSTELEADSGIYDTAAEIQDTAALLPDYAFKDSDSAWGTTFSGMVGGVIVIAVCVGACYAFRFFRKKRVS